MQNGAQVGTPGAGRLLGFVRVLVGGRIHDLAVQAISVDRDGHKRAGGFFADNGQLGILVDDAAPPPEIQAQIERGTAEAVRHLSRRYLN